MLRNFSLRALAIRLPASQSCNAAMQFVNVIINMLIRRKLLRYQYCCGNKPLSSFRSMPGETARRQHTTVSMQSRWRITSPKVLEELFGLLPTRQLTMSQHFLKNCPVRNFCNQQKHLLSIYYTSSLSLNKDGESFNEADRQGWGSPVEQEGT